MRTLMMLTIVALMTATMAKSDEKTITPQEFASNVAELPTKVGTWLTGEVDKTKAYQTKVWSEAKTKWPWTMFNKKD